jgi:hypothetical protein
MKPNSSIVFVEMIIFKWLTNLPNFNFLRLMIFLSFQKEKFKQKFGFELRSTEKDYLVVQNGAKYIKFAPQ